MLYSLKVRSSSGEFPARSEGKESGGARGAGGRGTSIALARAPGGAWPACTVSRPECLEAIAAPSVSTDASFVALQSLVSRMEVMAEGSYRAEHDQSTSLLTYHDLLQRYIRHEDVITFQQSEIASITFPLEVQSVTQVDSKRRPAVQLADVMIGAAIEAVSTIAGKRIGALDAKTAMALYARHQLIYMMPSIKFQEPKRFGQAGKLIYYFASNFHRSYPQMKARRFSPPLWYWH